MGKGKEVKTEDESRSEFKDVVEQIRESGVEKKREEQDRGKI